MRVVLRWGLMPALGVVIIAVASGAIMYSQQHIPASHGSPGSEDATRATIDLGRWLFYDQRLSANHRIACASCHRQEFGFSDGRMTPVGVAGVPLPRNAPGLFNSAELPALTWADPARTDLAQQVAHALFATQPPEMGAAGNERAILDRLRADPAYPSRFAAAFPADADPVTWPRVIEALAAFAGSLAARDTPYDRYVYQQEDDAMTPEARRGMALFFSPGLACGRCHVDIVPPDRATPPRWSDLAYLATGAGRSTDRGLAELTGDPSDAYRFRVPPLRNVAVTAPYMHDGSLPTLDAVVRFYESGGQAGAGAEPERLAARHPLVAGFVLSDAERRDLIAFLHALTDEHALCAPEFADPFAAP